MAKCKALTGSAVKGLSVISVNFHLTVLCCCFVSFIPFTADPIKALDFAILV